MLTKKSSIILLPILFSLGLTACSLGVTSTPAVALEGAGSNASTGAVPATPVAGVLPEPVIEEAPSAGQPPSGRQRQFPAGQPPGGQPLAGEQAQGSGGQPPTGGQPARGGSNQPSDGQTVTANNTYPVVDTGQSICYDNWSATTCPQEGQAFYGQDAQFDGNQPNYTLNADGLTVTNNVTGLTWTQSPDLNRDGDIDVNDKLTFAEAQTYADTTLNPQNYGGYSDWRLPTMKELYSLMDLRGTDPSGPDTSGLMPFINTNYFAFAYGDEAAGERNIDAQFWSSNAYVGSVFGNRSATFGLNLADGRIKGYPSGTSGPGSKLNYVYFVRGNTAYGVNDFIDNGDGTVTDYATGLMWSQDDSGVGLNWEEALAWAQQKNEQNYLGYSDWRLPNAKEMQSIVDYSRAPDASNSAAIDPVFNITAITNEGGQLDYPWFWTSTTHVRANGSGTAGVYISFGRAMGYMHGAWMDVHGAGAQRSDPKSGNPADWATGHGPQGDAIRIYNYVRLVRDGGVESVGGSDVIRSDQPPVGSPLGGPDQLPADAPPGGHTGQQPAEPAGAVPGGNSGGTTGQPLGTPPQEALDACSGATQGSTCTMTTPHRTLTGTCLPVANDQLACVPQGGPGGQ